MSRSEFRWNKKRKHYAYLHKDLGDFRKNILLTSKPKVFKKKNGKIKIIFNNVKLYAHPNPNKKINLEGLPTAYYVIPKNYVDNISSFDEHVFEDWSFDINDKRKIKRLKKERKWKKSPTIPLNAVNRWQFKSPLGDGQTITGGFINIKSNSKFYRNRNNSIREYSNGDLTALLQWEFRY